MPGPQLVSAVPLSKALKQRFPHLPIIWGGNFGSLYPAARTQRALCRLAGSGSGRGHFPRTARGDRRKARPATVAGLAFRRRGWLAPPSAPERIWRGPGELPAPPYHKIDVGEYLHPTFLGRRSGVYQASIGCPFGCNFCGVISVFGRREKVQAPARTAEHLGFLAREHGMDSVHFYDNNFFLNEAHAREVAARFQAARPALVVRGPRRRAVPLLRRDLARAERSRPDNGVLRRRIAAPTKCWPR